MNGKHFHTLIGQSNMNPPRRFRRIIERVCGRDREYFERHPEATSYSRPYVPGEAWPLFLPQGSTVRVSAVAPGVRYRWVEPQP